MKKIGIGQCEGVDSKAVEEVLKERGYEIENSSLGTKISAIQKAIRGYRVEREGNDIIISYGRLIQFYHALGQILSKADKENAFPLRLDCEGKGGVMYDCSRNGVLNVEEIKRFIRIQALMGLEQMFLYTEDTYEVEGYPYFGHLRGAYKKEEIKECDAYARRYGVEMVPCIQTLAHLKTALRWPDMRKFRDNEDILMVGEEDTYRLIDALLKSVSEMYSTRLVHLGMDEAWYLGFGNYRKKNGVKAQGEIIKYHLDRVVQICRKYGLEPMIWSDMFFVTQGQGDYYDVPADYEWEETQKPDKDITLVYWDYYGHDKERYQRMAGLHKKLSNKVYFAGGGWIWNGLAPNYAKAMHATKTAFEGIKDTRLDHSMLTLWGDNGAETPFYCGLPMMAYYSRCLYGQGTEQKELEEWYGAILGESWSDMLLLDKLDHIEASGEYNKDFANPSKTIFYQDPLLGIFDVQYSHKGLSAHYGDLAKELKKAKEKAGFCKDLFAYYELLAQIDAVKCDLGADIRRAYVEGNKEILRYIAETAIGDLTDKVEKMRYLRQLLWEGENKINGFEVLDIRFGGLIRRLKSAAERIVRYVNGEIPRMEELEEERLPYSVENPSKEAVTCNLWEEIISASNIKGY